MHIVTERYYDGMKEMELEIDLEKWSFVGDPKLIFFVDWPITRKITVDIKIKCALTRKWYRIRRYWKNKRIISQFTWKFRWKRARNSKLTL